MMARIYKDWDEERGTFSGWKGKAKDTYES